MCYLCLDKYFLAHLYYKEKRKINKIKKICNQLSLMYKKFKMYTFHRLNKSSNKILNRINIICSNCKNDSMSLFKKFAKKKVTGIVIGV